MKKKHTKKILIGLLTSVLGVSLVGCGTSMTMGNGTSSCSAASSLLKGSNVVTEGTNKDLEEIQETIDKYFYFDSDDQAMQDGIIKGYMESLAISSSITAYSRSSL